MDNLMYGAGVNTPSTKVVVELQSWFCVPSYLDSGTQCNAYQNWVPPDQNPNMPQQSISENESHAVVQYTTWYQPTMDARTVDIWDRGGEVAAMDWYGGQNDCPIDQGTDYHLSTYQNLCPDFFQYADHSYQDMMASIQTTLPLQRPGASMSFFMLDDQGSWHKSTCKNAGQNEPWCAANKMIADLHYAKTGQNEQNQGSFIAYFTQSAYLKQNTLPVIGFFQNEGQNGVGGDLDQCQNTSCRYDDNGDTCVGEANCFNQIYLQVRTWLDSNIGGNQYYMIFGYKNGCPALHPYSDGCYEWIKPHQNSDPSQVTVHNQEYADPDNQYNPKWQADQFYSNSLHQTGANHQPALIMGAAYKGFDDWMAKWWLDRILSQECGQTWLSTWSEMNQWYNPQTNPLPYMMVETWDDYEEGTEIETGISNCVDDTTFTLSLFNTHFLKWDYFFSDVSWGNPITVDHYILYYTTDNNSYFVKDSNITATQAGCAFSAFNAHVTCTGIDLFHYSWNRGTTYTLYIQAVGKPGITNHMSPGATYRIQ